MVLIVIASMERELAGLRRQLRLGWRPGGAGSLPDQKENLSLDLQVIGMGKQASVQLRFLLEKSNGLSGRGLQQTCGLLLIGLAGAVVPGLETGDLVLSSRYYRPYFDDNASQKNINNVKVLTAESINNGKFSRALDFFRTNEDNKIICLTSKNTFSAGEQFCYDIQSRNRGIVIGEITGGGANPGEFHKIDKEMKMFIPFAYIKNPITKTNWEGIGVKPNIKCNSKHALKCAIKYIS